MKFFTIFNQNDSEEIRVMLNYMKNTRGSIKERWLRTKNSVLDPMTLIPLIIGVIFIILTFCTDDVFLKTICTTISAVGIGIGVNYFSFFFRIKNDEREITQKAGENVRMLNSLLMRIYYDKNIERNDKDMLISEILNIIDSWKDYYEYSDTSIIFKLKKLRESKEDLKINQELMDLEYSASTSGLSSFITLSKDIE